MAGISVAVIKWVLKGTLGGSQTWSTGFYVKPVVTGVPTAANLATVLGNNSPLFQAMWNSIKTYVTTASSLTELQGYYYPAGASVASLTSRLAITPIAGTAGTGTGIDRALVASLKTDGAGRSERGRMYLPMNGALTDPAGFVATAACTALANALRTMFQGIEGASTDTVFGGQTTIVASRKTSTAFTVTQVRVDNLPDIQRRRQDKILATFTAVSGSLP